MRVAAALLLLALAGAQLARCADAGSAAYDESELVREVEAAAAMVGAAAEPAIPIAPASPTFTPYVPIEAAVICMDGAAPAIKLNKANCVARYAPVYNAVSILNDQAAQLSNELEAARQTIDEKTSRISDLYNQIEGLEKQLAAQAKRWAAWLEGNVTQAELTGEKKVNATQAAHDKTAVQLKFCKADLADAQEAKAATVAKLSEVQSELDQQQQECSQSAASLTDANSRMAASLTDANSRMAASLTDANSRVSELKRSLAECVEEADAIAAVAEEWAAEIKQAQQAVQAGDCSEAVELIQASVNDTQIALDECTANLIRLQASSIAGEEYPVHVRPAPAPAPAPEPAVPDAQAVREPGAQRKEAAPAPMPARARKPAARASAVEREEAAPAPAPQPALIRKPAVAAKQEEQEAVPAPAPQPALIRKPAVAAKPEQEAAPAPAPQPALIRKPAVAAKPEQEAAPAPAPQPALIRKPAVAAKPEQEAAPAPAPQPALIRKPVVAAKQEEQEAVPAPAPQPALIRKPVVAKPQQEAAPAPAPAAAEAAFQVTEARRSKKQAAGRKAGKQEKRNKKQKED